MVQQYKQLSTSVKEIQHINPSRVIESEVFPTRLQLKGIAELQTMIRLITKQVVCCNKLML